jgi:ABC-type sugar transport system permease subunit
VLLHIYFNAFRFFRMGYASALAWVLFLIIMVFTIIQFWLASRWVYYEGERVER